jgi:hypothetical protein
MIKVIAIEPEVMGDPSHLREYFKDFGTSKGRWIALVPHDWKGQVSSLLKARQDLGPVEKNNMRDKLRDPRNRDRFVKVPEHLLEEGSWFEAVETCCKDGVFDAAIVRAPQFNKPFFLVAGSFDPDEEPYRSKISSFVARTPEELFAPIQQLLRFSNELHIIDKYCMSAGSSQNTYREFFRRIFEFCRLHNRRIKTINLYRPWDHALDMERERVNYSSWMGAILQDDEKVCVHYMRESKGERVHMRAVFTDLALASGHYGFGGSKDDPATTDIVFRELDDLNEVRSNYLSAEKRAFDLTQEDVIEIVGPEKPSGSKIGAGFEVK